MIVREAMPDEADTLASLHASAFAAPWSAGEIAYFAQDRGAFALAAEVEGAAAGFILCRAMAGEAEILTLAVAPARRRQGIGRALVAAALARAAPVAASMLLEVAEDNAGAIALYAGLGFAACGRRPGYYVSRPGPPADALVMRRALNT